MARLGETNRTPGQVSWLPGTTAARSTFPRWQSGVATTLKRDVLWFRQSRPVTVARPRRNFTGFPFLVPTVGTQERSGT